VNRIAASVEDVAPFGKARAGWRVAQRERCALEVAVGVSEL